MSDPDADPPIIWVDDQAAFEPDLPILPAIGSVARRGIVERLEREGRRLATFVHPSAVVSAAAVLEPGVVVFPLVVVGARARIGRATIVNRGALVGHHTTIGPFSFVAPGANIAGKVHVGTGVHVGIGAIVRDRISVGDGAVIGSGPWRSAMCMPGPRSSGSRLASAAAPERRQPCRRSTAYYRSVGAVPMAWRWSGP